MSIKSFYANIHFFLLFQEKIVLLHPISQNEIPFIRITHQPRKGARVVEEARLESE